MVSNYDKLYKFRSPVARTSLIAICVFLSIDACLTIVAAYQYPYLVDYFHSELYISKAGTITFIYTSFAIAILIIALSTAVASYKTGTNYILINAGITGIFAPASFLVYFSSSSARYKAVDYVESYRDMISDYRLSSNRKIEGRPLDQSHNELDKSPMGTEESLRSFVNLIDSIQSKFSCCGVDSVHDWSKIWAGYVAPTCCNEHASKKNPEWSEMFKTDDDREFKYCTEESSFPLGCVIALKEDESEKYSWLSNLIVIAIFLIIADTIISLILFGLAKTEEEDMHERNELSIIGVSSKPRPSQPEIMNYKHRPSVVQTIGNTKENIAARAQAVRFNISTTPRQSISGPSKFSAAARRGSSFI